MGWSVCVELEKICKEVAMGYWGTFPLYSMGKTMIKHQNSLFSD